MLQRIWPAPVRCLALFQRQIVGYLKNPSAKVVAGLAALQVLEQGQKRFLDDFLALRRRQAQAQQIAQEPVLQLIGQPDDFFFQISVFILCMVILGGMGNIWGVIFGACFLTYLDREGLSNIGTQINNQFGVTLDVPKYEFGIFGIIIVVVMLFRPEGLIPSSRRAAELHEDTQHDEPLYDHEIAGA